MALEAGDEWKMTVKWPPNKIDADYIDVRGIQAGLTNMHKVCALAIITSDGIATRSLDRGIRYWLLCRLLHA